MKNGAARIPKNSLSQIAQSRARTFRNVFAGAPRQLVVKDFCESYGVTQDTFTRLTGFSPRAVAHWANGNKPSASTQRRLTEINRLFAALSELINKEAIGPWLKHSNSAFDGSTPLQVIERGESDRIWRMVSELESGEPG
jgi:transcriptional regulator with XRE-family HTH domain